MYEYGSNRDTLRLEIAVIRSKQTSSSISNRNKIPRLREPRLASNAVQRFTAESSTVQPPWRPTARLSFWPIAYGLEQERLPEAQRSNRGGAACSGLPRRPRKFENSPWIGRNQEPIRFDKYCRRFQRSAAVHREVINFNRTSVSVEVNQRIANSGPHFVRDRIHTGCRDYRFVGQSRAQIPEVHFHRAPEAGFAPAVLPVISAEMPARAAFRPSPSCVPETHVIEDSSRRPHQTLGTPEDLAAGRLPS